jgi:DNA-binding XRE family transcriptional regulator
LVVDGCSVGVLTGQPPDPYGRFRKAIEMAKKERNRDTLVRAYRKVANLTQSELGHLAGVSARTVDNAEKRMAISDNTASALVRTFNDRLADVGAKVRMDLRDVLEDILSVSDFFESAGTDRESGERYVAKPGGSSADERLETVRSIMRKALDRASRRSRS